MRAFALLILNVMQNREIVFFSTFALQFVAISVAAKRRKFPKCEVNKKNDSPNAAFLTWTHQSILLYYGQIYIPFTRYFFSSPPHRCFVFNNSLSVSSHTTSSIQWRDYIIKHNRHNPLNWKRREKTELLSYSLHIDHVICNKGACGKYEYSMNAVNNIDDCSRILQTVWFAKLLTQFNCRFIMNLS